MSEAKRNAVGRFTRLTAVQKPDACAAIGALPLGLGKDAKVVDCVLSGQVADLPLRRVDGNRVGVVDVGRLSDKNGLKRGPTFSTSRTHRRCLPQGALVVRFTHDCTVAVAAKFEQ